jgi:leader peptidase (prepilin peptidase)/N-methyltransferase
MLNALLALLFGLLIGSFLNVCIHRWPRGRSVVKPRSHCVRCRKIIAWYDNIPVVSYVILGGKCRHCGRAISLRYPTVELLTGLSFFWFVWRWGLTPEAVKLCIFAAILIALVFADFEKRLLPDELTLGGLAIGLLISPFVLLNYRVMAALLSILFHINLPDRWQSLIEAGFGAALPALSLWFVGWAYFKIRGVEGLGFGDVKLAAMIGAFLGMQNALMALLVGALSGSIIGFAFIKLAGKDPASYELPFGSFIGAAALIVALVGPGILGV